MKSGMFIIPMATPSNVARVKEATTIPIFASCKCFVSDVQIPGLVPIAAAALVLVAAAILASVTPAARAARVDVVRALRSE